MNNRITGKRKEFAQVSNHPLQNEKISLKAKGLYALIESYINIPNFILYKNTLFNKCKEGESAFQTAWNELKTTGYLKQTRHKNEKGKFYYEYELLFKPYVDFPLPENPPYGKVGVYNKTELNNTELNNTEELNNIPENKVSGHNNKLINIEDTNYTEVKELHYILKQLDKNYKRKRIDKDRIKIYNNILEDYNSSIGKHKALDKLVVGYMEKYKNSNHSIEHFIKTMAGSLAWISGSPEEMFLILEEYKILSR